MGDDRRAQPVAFRSGDAEDGADRENLRPQHDLAVREQVLAVHVDDGEQNCRDHDAHHEAHSLLERPENQPAKHQLLGERCPNHNGEDHHDHPERTLRVGQDVCVCCSATVLQVDDSAHQVAAHKSGELHENDETNGDRNVDEFEFPAPVQPHAAALPPADKPGPHDLSRLLEDRGDGHETNARLNGVEVTVGSKEDAKHRTNGGEHDDERNGEQHVADAPPGTIGIAVHCGCHCGR